ncbi:ribonuclease R [Clostridium sp. BJN0001]|uniref:ribonuclease R n=1 Tax=Clostridium sp. BJN0001 TaxID=2930219 RepID=UPI001FD0D76F|nr:ribonuclease R [Clostridium sp. BJN0001]
MGLKQTLLQFMSESGYNPMDMDELCAVFDIKQGEYNAFKKALRVMEHEGLITKTKKDRYMISDSQVESSENLVQGKLQVHAKGFGFLIPDEEGAKDVFIPSTAMSDAMNGDTVQVKITREDEENKKREGVVINVLERNITKVVGLYQDNKNFGFVVPDDKHISKDVYIAKKNVNGAKDGDIVTVNITKWPERDRKPEGEIVEILGKKGDRGIDILTIIKKNDLPLEFPKKVLDYAEGVESEISKDEYKNRRDLRNLKMVTIDGEDAKDLDDAVSIERLDNGNFKLGVHIADVSHYVRENNPLDKEALKRATSVYLIDRVIPMLPKRLSNGICSLNPQVDRLALSCIMEIDREGKVVDHDITESVIKTNERMTYTAVNKILKDNDKELIEKYDYLYDDFKAMEELCRILKAKREKRGSIDFEIEESKITLDDNGKPIDIRPYEREIGNRMIEEFMLVANETVAEHMYWTELPFVYRIHEDPDEEKLQKFKEFIYNLGYTVHWKEDIHPKTFQEVLEKVKGKSEETVVNTLLLRSMMQAKYSPTCSGHFGLAAKYYCHFTSPIRRYPDLQIHRIIKEYLHGSLEEKRINKLKNIVGYAAKQSSERERLAQDAEREVDDLKKTEFMKDRIGQEFDGIISSITSFGIFVELPNTVEGLIHVTDLDDDYYIFDEAHLCLTGERYKKVYRLGQKIKIVCVNVDIPNREIFFNIAGKEEEKEEKTEEN